MNDNKQTLITRAATYFGLSNAVHRNNHSNREAGQGLCELEHQTLCTARPVQPKQFESANHSGSGTPQSLAELALAYPKEFGEWA